MHKINNIYLNYACKCVCVYPLACNTFKCVACVIHNIFCMCLCEHLCPLKYAYNLDVQYIYILILDFEIFFTPNLFDAASKLQADAIFVYTKGGHMASLVSRNRPECPIFAFTDSRDVRIKLNLRWGLIPFRINFSEDMEVNLRLTFSLLKARGMVKSGDLIIAVSDVTPSSQSSMLQSIQVRRIP